MEYDLNEYDPFEPLWLWDDYGFRLELDTEPMTNLDWEEWLEADNYE